MNMKQLKRAISNFVMQKITVYLNVFGALMENGIRSNVECNLIITKKDCREGMINVKIKQELLNPNKLTVVAAKARYSASANEREMVVCFLAF